MNRLIPPDQRLGSVIAGMRREAEDWRHRGMEPEAEALGTYANMLERIRCQLLEDEVAQHRIDRPYENGVIEVVGSEQYEWRILTEGGTVIADSGDAGYGSPAVALRDGIDADL